MSKKTVEFEGHRTVKKPTDVAFTTRDGRNVDFVAKKPAREEVRVRFKAEVPKKSK
jgi:hypothetical protein